MFRVKSDFELVENTEDFFISDFKFEISKKNDFFFAFEALEKQIVRRKALLIRKKYRNRYKGYCADLKSFYDCGAPTNHRCSKYFPKRVFKANFLHPAYFETILNIFLKGIVSEARSTTGFSKRVKIHQRSLLFLKEKYNFEKFTPLEKRIVRKVSPRRFKEARALVHARILNYIGCISENYDDCKKTDMTDLFALFMKIQVTKSLPVLHLCEIRSLFILALCYTDQCVRDFRASCLVEFSEKTSENSYKMHLTRTIPLEIPFVFTIENLMTILDENSVSSRQNSNKE